MDHEEICQNRYVKIVCGLGMMTFICLLFPVYLDLVITHESVELSRQRFTPSKMSRIVVLSAAMPLLFDFLCDLSLPQRLILPRSCILVSLIVPNAIVLLIRHLTNIETTQMSFAFDIASYPLFYCGLLAYMVGEIESNALRRPRWPTVLSGGWRNRWRRCGRHPQRLVALTAVCKCVEFTFVTFHVFTQFGSWTTVLISSLASHILFTLLLVWIVRHLQGLDQRSRTFAALYATAIIFTWWLLTIVFMALPSCNGDASQLILVFVAVVLTTIESRMGHRDAVVATVSLQYHLHLVGLPNVFAEHASV
jgi:hypothetical protein